ncbi:unnamed protein product [Caenorhabditis brenneri]
MPTAGSATSKDQSPKSVWSTSLHHQRSLDDAAIFDAKGMLEVLYGAANKTVDRSIIKNSKAHFKKPEFCVGLIKGVNDQLSKCMMVTPGLLLTGGKNGRVILLIAESKNPKFGADKVSHRSKQGQGEIGKV